MSKHIKEIGRGFRVVFLYKVIGVILAYVFTFVVTNKYGPKGIGNYSLSISVLSIAAIISTLGCQTSILRLIPQFEKQNPNFNNLIVFLKILVIVVLASTVLSFGLYLFSNYLTIEIFHDASLANSFKYITFMVPIYAVLIISMQFIRGMRNVALSEYLRNVNIVLFSCIILLILMNFSYDISTPFISHVYALAITLLISLIYIFKGSKGKKILNVQNLSYKYILKISSPMLITTSAFLLMGNIDNLMIGAFLKVKDVGLYSVAVKLASFTSFILFSANSIIGPKIAELYWAEEGEALKSVLSYSTKIIFWSTFPVIVGIVVFSEKLLLLFGSEFIYAKNVLLILLVGQCINVASGSVGMFLNMTGKEVVFRNIAICALFANIIMNYLLIPLHGIMGAAIATAFSMALWNIASVLYSWRYDGVITFYLPFAKE